MLGQISEQEISDTLVQGKDNMYILELEVGTWLAPWDGDPGRTLDVEKAVRFVNKFGAFTELKYARKFRPFENAKVVEIELLIKIIK